MLHLSLAVDAAENSRHGHRSTNGDSLMIDPHHIEEFSTVPVLTLTTPPTLPTVVPWIFPRMTYQTPNRYHGCVLSIIANNHA